MRAVRRLLSLGRLVPTATGESLQRRGGRLVINPGAAGPRRFDAKPSVAILRIANGNAEVEIVPLMD